MQVPPNRSYALLKPSLDAVLNSAKLNPDDRSKSQKISQDLEKSLLDIMRKQDALFDAMNPQSVIMGSVKKKLKVNKPDEFDVNIGLELPIDKERLKEVWVSE
jgi:tRNA nucleotidyltransferase (CCA-adding enzyme)